MTARAIVKMNDAYSISISTTDYNVSVGWFATDGTTNYEGSAGAQIPFAWDSNRANRFIRERVSAAILASCSLTIDPEEVYIPLSS